MENIRNIKNNKKFMKAVSSKKTMTKSSNKGREKNMNKFFMGVRKERSATISVDTSCVTAAITENPLSNDMTPPTSTSTISVNCTEQKSIPDVST